MLNETRVNLKHLLEDIRDSYTSPLEEVIITELIANTLDSKASRVDFMIDKVNKFFRCIDNGLGMKRASLREYHNIAASAKQKGQGIGFAGVGAKLSLLLAEKVITESKGGHGSRAATEWKMANPYRAPWKFVPTGDVVPHTRGTAVTIYFTDDQIHLLKPEFVQNTILKHFYPLLHDKIREEILRYFYKKPVEFVINGELLVLPREEQRIDNSFKIFLGKSKKAIGSGFFIKKVFDQNWLQKLTGKQPMESRLPFGLAVSTYGKIIKNGWEWLGILPKNYESLCGLVEIPALSQILTTNKNDFLSDSASLKTYYKIRKSIQQSVVRVLKALGEYGDAPTPTADKNIKPLTRQIENALSQMTGDFPELSSLLSSKRGGKNAGSDEKKLKIDAVPKTSEKDGTEHQISTKTKADNDGREKTKKSAGKRSGLEIILEDLKDEPDSLGRIVGDAISINTLHPAWQKALRTNSQQYHILLTVGLVLSEFLDPEKHPQEFLSRLLSAWGKLAEGGKAQKLF